MPQCETLDINGEEKKYYTLFIDLSSLNLFSWLEQQKLFPKIYWEDKETKTVHAAIGSLLTLHSIPQLGVTSSPHARFFGGIGNGELGTCFWLPEFEIVQDKKRTFLQINSFDHPPTPRAMSRLLFEEENTPSEEIFWESREDLPAFEAWLEEVDSALQKIQEGVFKKVVLARKTSFQGTTHWNSWDLLQKLKSSLNHVTFFCFQFSKTKAFLGATPENLYVRDGLHLRTEAIAGTRPLGQTDEETFFLKNSLISSEKEMEEFEYVKQAIDQSLDPLCATKKWDLKERVLSTGSVQHLYAHLSATLKERIPDEILIHILHPTPALGGFPRKEALDFLQEHEPFLRTWYGNPIGILSAHHATLAIGIRSALIKGQLLSLFAGAGIVRQSVGEEEWEELEQKIAPFTSILYMFGLEAAKYFP